MEGMDPADRRKEFLERRDKLDGAGTESSKAFDQAVLTLAAGALGLSLTFVQQIAPEPARRTLWLLILAWIALLASILATLSTFLCGQDQADERIDDLDRTYNPGHPVNVGRRRARRRRLVARIYGEPDPMGEAVDSLNWWSIGGFVCGVVLLAGFTVWNLGIRETDMNSSDKGDQVKPEERGRRLPSNPPPPPPQQPPATPPATKEAKQ